MTNSAQRELTLTPRGDLELVMTRAFKAPASLLYDMWTKPEHVQKWYPVRGTTMTVCEIDLRVGGAWRWVIARPGMEIGFAGVFRELAPPHRLQRTEVYEGMPGPGCLMTLTFDERGSETMLTIDMLFATKADRDMCLKSGMELGVKEGFAKIDVLVGG